MQTLVGPLVAAIVQIMAAVVGVLAVFGINVPAEAVKAIGASLEQLLGGLILLATLLPGLFALVRKLMDGTAPPPNEGGFADVRLIAVLAAVTIAASCATPGAPGRMTPAQTIAAGQAAVGEYFQRTVRFERAGVLTPKQALQRDELALEANRVLRDARAALALCESIGTPDAQCMTAQAILTGMPTMMDEAEIELMRRLK